MGRLGLGVRFPGPTHLVVLARHQSRGLGGFIGKRLGSGFGLGINRERNRVVDLKEQGASLDCLRYTFRYDRDLKGRDQKYLKISPSANALKRERDKLHDMT